MFKRCMGVFLALLLVPVGADAADIELDAASHFAIDATINGHPVRLRVDPAGSEHVILNPETEARLGLRGSLVRSEARIGPVRLRGASNAVRLSIGAWAGRHRLLWMDQPVVDGADGLIGPASLPYDRVAFALGPARPGEIATTLPMRVIPRLGLSHALRIGDRLAGVRFSLIDAESLATAAAGAQIASLHGGSWAGPVRPRAISFGVLRPVRPMILQRPLAIANLLLDRLLVRTADHRGDLELPPEPDSDPDEVIVTAASRQRAVLSLTVGLDRLSQCSRIVWDNVARLMLLHCLNLPERTGSE